MDNKKKLSTWVRSRKQGSSKVEDLMSTLTEHSNVSQNREKIQCVSVKESKNELSC